MICLKGLFFFFVILLNALSFKLDCPEGKTFCKCEMNASVQVKVKPDFREKFLKTADKSKYYTESKAKAVKSEDHTKQTVSKTPDAVKQESSDISRSDYTEPKTRMEFVFVKGGDFEMGGNKVRIDDFYMGKYEVTNAQFMKFRPDHYEKRNKPYSSDKDKHPVIDVTWNDAEAFAKWLSDKGEKFRMPTEAEWEYAARAGTTTKYLWGDKPEDACKYANVRECNKQGVISVGGLTPNNFGLYDMAGNVWEWMNDEAVKGSRDSDRVMRGGSYKDFEERVSNSLRDQAMPDTEKPNLGFRLIRENKPSKK